MPDVWWITGTARSDRSDRIDEEVLGSLDSTLLIVPSESHARERLSMLLRKAGRSGVVGNPVITFKEFAERIRRDTSYGDALVGPVQQRLLLQRALDQARIKHDWPDWDDALDTDGFLSHLQLVIKQIKQAEIKHEDFQEIARTRSVPVDEIVARVYAEYHELLQRNDAVDLEGMYWLAKIVCETGRPPGLLDVGMLVFDGFDDFTPSEFSLIESAAHHVDVVGFGLNLDTGGRQRNLYSVPRTTLNRIRATFPEAAEAVSVEEPAPDSESDWVSQTLLLRDDPASQPALRDDIEFLRCHSRDHELETIGRRIKRLIRQDGVAPHRIAVVTRRVEPVAQLIRDIFHEFGIPVRGVQGVPLADSAFVSFALHIVESGDRWTPQFVRESVMAPWIVGAMSPAMEVWPLLLRMAPASERAQDWIDSVERLIARIADGVGHDVVDLIDHVPDAKEAALALKCALEELERICNRFSRKQRFSESINALQHIVIGWPLDQALASVADAPARELERKSIHEFAAVLGLLERWHEDDQTEVARSALARALRHAVGISTVILDGPASGVEVLDMERARYHRFDHVFVTGLTQGEVPAKQAPSAIYSESERQELSVGFNIPFDDTERHSLREVLLFQRMFYTARERLYLCWHELAASGQVIGRSLYLHEVEDILRHNAVQTPSTEDAVLLPEPTFAASARDLMNLTFASAVDSKSARRLYPDIARRVAVEKRRFSDAQPDAYDGALADKESFARIATSFGNDHVFSASALERYAQCPFLFFSERVLKLFNVEAVEDAIDASTRGSVLHEALRNFHARFPEQAVADIERPQANTAMQEALNKAFLRNTAAYRHLGRGVLAGEKARMQRILQHYLEIEPTQKENAWKPWRLEYSFGEDDEIVVDLPAGPIRLRGRIDRIDRDGDAIRLVDYKTGEVQPKQVDAGKVFQVILYAMIADQTLFPNLDCRQGMYLTIGKRNSKRRCIAVQRSATERNDNWNERAAATRDAIAACLAGMRAGRFYPKAGDAPCKGCSAERVCRFDRRRLERKAPA